MKIETTPQADRQIEILVEFEDQELESFKQRAARKISRQAKISGFRPGKAPYAVIQRMYGEEAIEQEAIEILLDEKYPEILKQAEITPSGPGSLKDIPSRKPLQLLFLVPLQPAVDLKDYQSIRLPYELKPITDEQVEQATQRIRTSYATAEPVERPSALGDLVYVKLSGRLLDPKENEEAQVLPEQEEQFIIEENEQDSWPFPGFTPNLIGLSAGETKTFQHTFPEDWEAEALRGRTVEYTVTVESIKGLILPDLNDEFAQSLSPEFQTTEDLQKRIRQQMEDQARREYDNDYFDRLIAMIIEQSQIEYPPQMLEEEIEHLLEHLKQDLAEQHIELDAYFKMINTDRATFIENEVKPAAIKRLLRSLILEEVGRAEKIDISQRSEEVSSLTMSQLRSAMAENPQKRLSEEAINNATMRAMMAVYNQAILDRLKARANGEEIPEPQPETETVPQTEASESVTDSPASDAAPTAE